MHVTLVSGVDPAAPGASGTRSFVLGLTERLRDHGVSVALVAGTASAFTIPGVQCIPIRSDASSAWFLMRLFKEALRLPIPDESIVHVQRPDDLVPFAVSGRAHPAVCTLHGRPAPAIRRRRGAAYGALYGILEGIGLRRADQVIAVDSFTARWYEERYPRLPGRMHVIPVAVDTQSFRPMDRGDLREQFGLQGQWIVLFAGRLSAEKRVESIIRAVQGIPDAILAIAGDGPEENTLRGLVRGGNVRFLGPVAHDRMPGLLNTADVLVLASEYEGLPTIVIEAFACGIPVVATAVGALPDVVKAGKTGWLVEDPKALGPTIADALPLASERRDDCLEAARPYSWEAVTSRVLDVYRKAGA